MFNIFLGMFLLNLYLGICYFKLFFYVLVYKFLYCNHPTINSLKIWFIKKNSFDSNILLCIFLCAFSCIIKKKMSYPWKGHHWMFSITLVDRLVLAMHKLAGMSVLTKHFHFQNLAKNKSALMCKRHHFNSFFVNTVDMDF